MLNGPRPILSAVAAAAALSALGVGPAMAAPTPAPAPKPVPHASGPWQSKPAPAPQPGGQRVVPNKPKPAPNKPSPGVAPRNTPPAPPAANRPPASGVPPAPGAVPKPRPVAPPAGPGAAVPLPPGVTPPPPAKATPPAPTRPGSAASAVPQRPVVLTPAPGTSRVAPAAPKVAPPKAATVPTPGAVRVPSPVPGGRDVELVPPAAVAGSSGPVSSAGAIDKAAVNYDQHGAASVTDAEIEAGLLAAGVNPQLLPRFTAATRIIIGGESGGSANAVNRWDSNAWGATQADGAPHNSSRGVMQTIPSTFAAYHAPGTSTSIYNPTANIAAGWRYASDRYAVNLQTGAGLDSFMARGTGRGVGY